MKTSSKLNKSLKLALSAIVIGTGFLATISASQAGWRYCSHQYGVYRCI